MRENWYKTAKIGEALYKNASLRDTLKQWTVDGWLPSGLLGAALAVLLLKLSISLAASNYNVNEEDVRKAVNNKQLVEEVQKIVKEQETKPSEIININKPKPVPKKTETKAGQPKIEKIVDVLLTHEGLLPGQTPFRITNPKMRKWDRILGYQINKNPKAPSNRRNFIFFSNPEEVPLAVKKLLVNYSRNPEKYGLDSNPSLYEAIKKFDQTNAENKISFMVSQIPNLNVHAPLRNFIN